MVNTMLNKLFLANTVVIIMMSMIFFCVFSTFGDEPYDWGLTFLVLLSSFLFTGMWYTIFQLHEVVNKIAGRFLIDYNEQVICLNHIISSRKRLVRLDNVWEKQTSESFEYDITLYYYNETLCIFQQLKLSLSQAKKLHTQMGGTCFYETGENGLGRTRMLKHEFDTLLVMYAIDVLEELQQQISKNDHLIPKK